MLRVKTKLGVSKIEGAGIGLFADEFIPKDTIIWEYTEGIDQVYTEEFINNCIEPLSSFLKKYCFKFCGLYYLCVDNARFYNHSNNPNCYSSDFMFDQLGYTRALRDIEIGEELTDNYNEFGFIEEDGEFNKVNY